MPSLKQPASLNIKNPEVYRAAVRLAKLQGTSITGAVLNALRSELDRQGPKSRASNDLAKMRQFAQRISAMPILDPRSDDEILGYGPEGYLNGD